ncbi:MAG: 1,4-alpha-glucan branching protein domain-containing protein [Elusimicrobiales bacterium]
MKRTDIVFLFHFHLPYVYHPEAGYFEENWYYQNLAESYIPFLMMMEDLANNTMVPSVTISLSPTLCYMMENEKMADRFVSYINSRISLIESERSIINDEKIHRILDIYEKRYVDVLDYFERYSRDILTPFKLLKSRGIIEIITTPLTYPILPLLTISQALNFQITEACRDFSERFLERNLGMFLPECGWSFEIEKFLLKNNIEYIFLDERALEDDPPNSLYQLESGIRIFTPDHKIFDFLFGKNGVTRNPNYREFYRDIGYERDLSYLSKYTGCSFHAPTGLKYSKITGVDLPIEKKQIYDAEIASRTLKDDVERFVNFLLSYCDGSSSKLLTFISSAEIFGHRWFEGIDFLKNFFIYVRKNRLPLNFVLPSSYIKMVLSPKVIKPSISSWSDNGFFDKWLNERNDFIYPYIHEISKKFISVASRYRNLSFSPEIDRILRQAVREISLMQSSDWAIMISTSTHREYALKRINEHYMNVMKIIKWLLSGGLDREELSRMEKRLPIFPFIGWKNFLSLSQM